MDSTHIRRVHWEPLTRELRVEFHQGRVYRYSDVPFETWQAFMTSDSKGLYIRTHIATMHRAEEIASFDD